jgi:NADP-reducing hydrogenase subunit HndD
LHHGDSNILLARQKALYSEDKAKVIRKSHENPSIQKLYAEFLERPMSEKAHQLLHTRYFDRSTHVEITKD